MKKVIRFILTTIPLFLLIAACGNEEMNTNKKNNETSENNKVEVVTSIFPVYEITKAIAGDEAEVSLMVGANEDAHHYEPSAQAVASVSEADIFIYSSETMEFWAQSLLDVVENEDLQIVELAEGLDLSPESHHEAEHEQEDHDHDHGGTDPHFWLDPVAVSQQISLIVDVLIAAYPEGEEVYRTNAEALSTELDTLNKAYEKAFEGAGNRSFVVQHQAFGHLANRYHLNQVAVGGLTTEVEPAPRHLAEIVDFVNEQAVSVVYYQSGENSAIAETIAAETGTEIAVLHDLESAPLNLSGEENVYLEAMYQNLEQLKKSIQ